MNLSQSGLPFMSLRVDLIRVSDAPIENLTGEWYESIANKSSWLIIKEVDFNKTMSKMSGILLES